MDWTRPSIHCDQNQRIKKELERCRFWFTQNSRTPWLSYNFKHCQIGTPFNSEKKNSTVIFYTGKLLAQLFNFPFSTFQLSFLIYLNFSFAPVSQPSSVSPPPPYSHHSFVYRLRFFHAVSENGQQLAMNENRDGLLRKVHLSIVGP